MAPRKKDTTQGKAVDPRLGRSSRVGSGTKQSKKVGQEEAFLTESEMLRMDGFVKESEIDLALTQIIKLQIELKQKDIKTLQLEVELEQVKLATKQTETTDHKVKSLEYLSNLKSRYQIDRDRWSYDPITGKILFED